MPRFVILKHDFPFLHWDFLLEAGPVAHAWRLLRAPCPDEPIAAERLPDHRLLYLDYEGPVGGGRGSVRRIASGTFEDRPDSGTTDSAMTRIVHLKSPILFRSATLFTSADGREFWQFESST